MKLLTLFFSLCTITTFGQVTNQLKTDSTDIYVDAFNRYCEQIIKYSPNIESIQVEEGKFFSYLLSDKVKDLSIKKVSRKDIKKMSKWGRSTEIIEIVPLRNDENMFYITIITFRVTKNKKQFIYSNQGGIRFNYSFNPKTGEYTFMSL